MATYYIANGNIYINYIRHGKRIRKCLNKKPTQENIKDVKKLIKRLEAEDYSQELIKLNRIKEKRIRLESAFLKFLETKKHLKISSLDHYKLSFAKLKNFTGNIRVYQVNKKLIDELENNLKTEISENSIASYFNKLKVIFNFFVQKNWIETNPIPSKKLEPKDIVIIPDNELELILDTLEKHNRNQYKFISILLMTGLRVSELINLRFEDINFRDNIIKVKNEKASRFDELPLYDTLKKFIMNEWTNYTGKLFNYKDRSSLKFFRRFLKRNNFNVYSLHTLRKTYISKLINSGLSIYDVMTLARHKNIKTTLKYYTAAELNRIGNEIMNKSNIDKIINKKYNRLKIINSN